MFDPERVYIQAIKKHKKLHQKRLEIEKDHSKLILEYDRIVKDLEKNSRLKEEAKNLELAALENIKLAKRSRVQYRQNQFQPDVLLDILQFLERDEIEKFQLVNWWWNSVIFGKKFLEMGY